VDVSIYQVESGVTPGLCTLLEFFRHFLHCLATVTLNMEFLFVFDDFIYEGLTTVVTYD
jgi:hypothetical protein